MTVIIWRKSVRGREFRQGVREIPKSIGLYHKIKNKIEEKMFLYM